MSILPRLRKPPPAITPPPPRPLRIGPRDTGGSRYPDCPTKGCEKSWHGLPCTTGCACGCPGSHTVDQEAS